MSKTCHLNISHKVRGADLCQVGIKSLIATNRTFASESTNSVFFKHVVRIHGCLGFFHIASSFTQSKHLSIAPKWVAAALNENLSALLKYLQWYQVTKQSVLCFSHWVIWHLEYASFSMHVTYNHFWRNGCSWLTNSFAKCHKQCLTQGFYVVFPCSLSIFTYTFFFQNF